MRPTPKRIAVGLTPPIIANFLKTKTLISRFRGLSAEYYESDRRIVNDNYIQWISQIIGGFLSPGNIRAFDHAAKYMPSNGAVIEIGSLFGNSTNLITYLTAKYRRDNPVFTCDPWSFEMAGDSVLSAYFDTSSENYREYAKQIFIDNMKVFSADILPYSIEAFSNDFFSSWKSQSNLTDVFGRDVTLGGPISFAFIDGAHAFDLAKNDFDSVDELLLPGGFILLDDSSDGSPFGVARVAQIVKANPAYEVVFKTPNYFYRKK